MGQTLIQSTPSLIYLCTGFSHMFGLASHFQHVLVASVRQADVLNGDLYLWRLWRCCQKEVP